MKIIEKMKIQPSLYWYPYILSLPIFLYMGLLAYIAVALLGTALSILILKNSSEKNSLYSVIVSQHALRFFKITPILFILILILPYPLIQPPILSELPNHGKFFQRVMKAYPEGMSHKEVVQNLKWQMFDIRYNHKSQHFYAAYHRNWPIFCVRDWHISWQVENDKIKNIQTSASSACI